MAMVITKDDTDIPLEREDRFSKWELLQDMEKDLIVDRLTVRYSGVFSFDELLSLIDKWCIQKGYIKERVSSKHKIGSRGKHHVISFKLHRKVTSLDFSVIFLELDVDHMTDVDKVIDGQNYHLNEGEVAIVFISYHMSHKKMRWETKPKFAVIRAFIDKFIIKLERPEVPGTIVGDTKDLAMKLRAAMILWYHRLSAEKGEYRIPSGMWEEIPDLHPK